MNGKLLCRVYQSKYESVQFYYHSLLFAIFLLMNPPALCSARQHPICRESENLSLHIQPCKEVSPFACVPDCFLSV